MIFYRSEVYLISSQTIFHLCVFLSKIQTANIYSKCDFILEDNVTFQVSETGNWHKESNVKIIIYAYESDDSSDILLNEK